MKQIVLLILLGSVGLMSCSSSQECEYLKSMGKRSYDGENQKIKEFNIKISNCPKQGSGFLSVIDSECKKRLLKEFSEENNCSE